MTESLTPDHLFTSHEVGALLQVDPTSVAKWVNQGRIQAFRTPGGHRRIRAADLVAFLEKHQMRIPEVLRAFTRRRLLVVDDSEPQLRAIARLLKRYTDLDLQLVDNGVDALVRVGSFRPHLMVLDIYMPGLDGIEVCRRLKANPETSDLSVIITSANLTPELREKALQAGAAQCLPKPIDLAVVLRAIGIQPQP